MKILTLWGWRKDEDMPELMEAWDEYTIEQNYEGWQEACNRAIASWGSDLDSHRQITLAVDESAVVYAFQSPIVPASVTDDV